MNLEIITPEKIVFQGTVKSVTLPGTLGSFQILTNHAPLISTLTKGSLSYVSQNDELTELQIEDGVAEVHNNRITVCVESVSNEQ